MSDMTTKEYKKLKTHALKKLDALIDWVKENPHVFDLDYLSHREGVLKGLERARREVMMSRKPEEQNND